MNFIYSILIYFNFFFKKNLFIVSDADGYKGGKVKIEMFPLKKKIGLRGVEHCCFLKIISFTYG